MKQPKQETVTFKAEPALVEAMEGIANRSRFIRDAILAALGSACPLCMGSGILTPHQRQHWERFAETHVMAKCPECHEKHLICTRDGA